MVIDRKREWQRAREGKIAIHALCVEGKQSASKRARERKFQGCIHTYAYRSSSTNTTATAVVAVNPHIAETIFSTLLIRIQETDYTLAYHHLYTHTHTLWHVHKRTERKRNMAKKIKPVVTLNKFSRSSCTSSIGSVKFSYKKSCHFVSLFHIFIYTYTSVSLYIFSLFCFSRWNFFLSSIIIHMHRKKGRRKNLHTTR